MFPVWIGRGDTTNWFSSVNRDLSIFAMLQIFNKKRRGNQGKSCEVGGVLIVFFCLTFFATTIIFGVSVSQISTTYWHLIAHALLPLQSRSYICVLRFNYIFLYSQPHWKNDYVVDKAEVNEPLKVNRMIYRRV